MKRPGFSKPPTLRGERFTDCVWPNCNDAATEKVKLPLCDHHALRAFRRVRDLVRDEIPHTIFEMPAGRPGPGHAPTVYFLRFAGKVKIGYTTNLPSRLTALPPGELLGIMPGDRTAERTLHERFNARLVGGREWFEECDEIHDYVAKNCDPLLIPIAMGASA